MILPDIYRAPGTQAFSPPILGSHQVMRGWAEAHLFCYGVVELEPVGGESMDGLQRVNGLIEPVIDGMGYEVVRVAMMGAARPTLQIMVERKDLAAMTVDDCAAVSRAVSAVLDVEDPIEGHYSLEVTSPGIDRPLTRRKDFERFAGFEAKVEMEKPVGERRRFHGKLLGVEGSAVRLAMPDRVVSLELNEIRKAKLMLTDELLAAATAEAS